MRIRERLEIIVVVVTILLLLAINIIIAQAKDEVIEKRMFTTKEIGREGSFIDVTNDIRRSILEEYVQKHFYNKYFSEDMLMEKIHKNAIKIWTLTIKSIDLIADINEGTDVDNLNKYIGHFEETNIFNGNVGLAAHNRGYPVNYFENLDKVEIGEAIEYRIDNFVKKYKVKSINVIKDTDWTYLGETDEDMITLITCVRNKPEYRLCVQAYKESEEFINDEEKSFSSWYDNNFIIKYSFARGS